MSTVRAELIGPGRSGCLEQATFPRQAGWQAGLGRQSLRDVLLTWRWRGMGGAGDVALLSAGWGRRQQHSL